MHQIQKSYEPGDHRQFKGAGDDLKTRLVGKEAGLLLRDFIDQLERMNPEERVKHAAHKPDQVYHRMRALSREISDANAEKLDYGNLYKAHKDLASAFFNLVCVALQTGVRF
jgi:hypothetical protein